MKGNPNTPKFFIGNDDSEYIKVSGAKPYPIFEEILNRMLAQ